MNRMICDKRLILKEISLLYFIKHIDDYTLEV